MRGRPAPPSYLLVAGSQSRASRPTWSSPSGRKVFANPMATAAAIDRIVHHSVILEFDLPSYRTSEAQSRQAEDETDRQN